MNSKSKHIVVVEDDKSINNLIAYNLRRVGYVVTQIFDGAQASAYFDSNPAGVVILDIMLPGVDGLCLCRKIKSAAGSHKNHVIIISAKSEPQDKLYANLLGADFYFAKPFGLGELMNAVDEVASIEESKFEVLHR